MRILRTKGEEGSANAYNAYVGRERASASGYHSVRWGGTHGEFTKIILFIDAKLVFVKFRYQIVTLFLG